MRCEDCGHQDSRMVGGLCTACRRHPRNQGDGLEPLDGQPCPGDVPMTEQSVDRQVQDLFMADVRDGACEPGQIPRDRRRQAVAMHLDARHRDGCTDMEFLVEGDRHAGESWETGKLRDLHLIAHVVSVLHHPDNDSSLYALGEAVLDRAECWYWPWLQEQLDQAWQRHDAGRWE